MVSGNLIKGQQWAGAMEQPCRYRFVWQPPVLFQEQMAMAIQAAGGNPGKAGEMVLEFASFSASPRLEDTLMRWTQRICGLESGIVLEINNFSGMLPGSIFARIGNQDALRGFLTRLRKLDLYLTGNGHEGLQASGRFFISMPATAGSAGFETLLYRLGRTPFSGRFTIDKITLQRADHGRWTTAGMYHLSETA